MSRQAGDHPPTDNRATSAVNTILIAVVLAVLFAPLASCEEENRMTFKNVAVPLALYGGAAAWDLHSTERVLDAGGREGNPFMQDRGQRLGMKSIAALGFVAMDVRLQSKRSRWLWPFRIAAMALSVAPAVHNELQARR